MKQEELIQQFPWTNYPALFEVYPGINDKFTLTQWRDIDSSGVPDALKRGALNQLLLPVFLNTLYEASIHPSIAELMSMGLTTFKELSANSLGATLTQKMTSEELITMLPWIAHPLIRTYAERFTLTQWADMHSAGVPEFLSSGNLDDLLLPALFESIFAVANHPEVATMIQAGDRSFTQIVKSQIEIVTQAAQQQSLVRPQEVFDWFGPELSRQFERQVESFDQADNIIQVLSSSKVRALLSGDKATIDTLTVTPPALMALKGQDARMLLKTNKMSLKQLLALATELAKPLDRKFPDWVEDSLELKKLANEFTDMQLDMLGRLFDVAISQNRELKCSFLRSILLKTSVNDQQKIQELTNPTTFKQLVLSHQEQFLQVAQKDAVPIAEHLADTFNAAEIPIISASKPESSNDFLIRRYVSEYKKNPLVSIPTDTKRRQEAFECALRNAALNGEYMDLIALIHEVSNINARGQLSGKTALHSAAVRASKTGDRLCFDTLANLPKIDFRLKDREGNTALDLWDFKKCPDEKLMEKWILQKRSVASTLSQESPAAPKDDKSSCCLM